MDNMKDLPASTARDYLLARMGRPGSHPLAPLDHLAFALMLDEGETSGASLAAIAKLHQTYVDWNEIRVSRGQELARALDGLTAREQCALRIIEEYNAFFERRGSLSFDFLETCKVAEGRKLLHQYLPRLKKGAVALLLFEFCPGASLPLSDEGLKAARGHGLVSRSGDKGQFAKVMAEALPASATVKLVQLLEIEATGNPYGEAAPAAKPARKKAK